MNTEWFENRPIIIAITGSNGAGKTTFFHSYLSDTGLFFVNADDLAEEFGIGAYEAAKIADKLRHTLVTGRESFIFETVLSDPVGEKISFLKNANSNGYHVALIFILINDESSSIERVALRVTQGGHDVPEEKLRDRFARTRQNLKRAIESLPLVLIFDNSDLFDPYRFMAVYVDGHLFAGRPVEN